MTNEEKKAILYMQRQVKIRTLDLSKWQNGVKVLLNLIEKQSKEIEELKDRNKKLQYKAKELIFEKQQLSSALLDSIPNDKIKAKIEELENSNKNTLIRGEKILVLQSLLEKE